MIGYLYKLYLEERKTRLGKTMINKEISASTWRCLVTSMVCTTFMFLLCSNIIMDGSCFFSWSIIITKWPCLILMLLKLSVFKRRILTPGPGPACGNTKTWLKYTSTFFCMTIGMDSHRSHSTLIQFLSSIFTSTILEILNLQFLSLSSPHKARFLGSMGLE